MHFVEAKGILSSSGGRCGMNIYRGCMHGCIYCDSRSKCYQFTHPFEDIEVKQNASELLEAALDRHFPGVKERYIKRYGNAYELPSPKAKELQGILKRICREQKIMATPEKCFAYMQYLPEKHQQMSIFDL